MQIKFSKWDCKVVFLKYGNGRTAIELVDTEPPYFESITVASVNLPDEPMKEDEIAIKNYSENEGILDVLVNAKIVSAPVRYADSGFVTIPICKLLIKQ